MWLFSVRQSKSKEETVTWLNKDEKAANWTEARVPVTGRLSAVLCPDWACTMGCAHRHLLEHSHVKTVTPSANRGCTDENPANASLHLQLCCCQLRTESGRSPAAPLKLPKPSSLPPTGRQPQCKWLPVVTRNMVTKENCQITRGKVKFTEER